MLINIKRMLNLNVKRWPQFINVILFIYSQILKDNSFKYVVSKEINSTPVQDFANLTFRQLHKQLVDVSFDNIEQIVSSIPKSLNSRRTKSLNGIYDFCLDFNNDGFSNKWPAEHNKLLQVCPTSALFSLPVPSSFNDLILSSKVRDFVGWVWYEREFNFDESFCQLSFNSIGSTLLHFESANYLSLVWLDGNYLGSHIGGHLPFAFNITQYYCKDFINEKNKTQYFSDINSRINQFKLTIAISNELNNETIPTGRVLDDNHNQVEFVNASTLSSSSSPRILKPNFDFFHYAGLMGDVKLVYLPSKYIENVIHNSTEIKYFDYNRNRSYVCNENYRDLSGEKGEEECSEYKKSLLEENITINNFNYNYQCKKKHAQSANLNFQITIKSTLPTIEACNNSLEFYSNVLRISVFDSNKIQRFNKSILLISNKSPCYDNILFEDGSNELQTIDLKFEILQPELWSPRKILTPKNDDNDNNNNIDDSIEANNLHLLNYKAALYSMQISLVAVNKDNHNQVLQIVDEFELKFGIREFKLYSQLSQQHALMLNQQSIKLAGFGYHMEQFPSGRTVGLSALSRDFQLFKSIYANTIRTSHYPYNAQFLDLADENGIMVIAEAPAVGLSFKTKACLSTQLKLHKIIMHEMFSRDNSRPSVIAWSLANEPSSNEKFAKDYFTSLIAYCEKQSINYLNLNLNKIFTAAIAQSALDDNIAHLLNIVMINKYAGWYDSGGCIGNIKLVARDWIKDWLNKHPNKAILISEFGAEAIHGFTSTVMREFGEDYQQKVIELNHNVFDEFYNNTTNRFIGELVWNFRDFETIQSLTRVFGNHKGVFTQHDRQPKLAVSLLMERYKQLNLDENQC